MAAAKIIVVEKNEGEKIAYDVSTTKIIFGDDDLMVNIKNRERDEEVTLDICKDTGRLNRWRKYRSKGVCGTGHYPGKGI